MFFKVLVLTCALVIFVRGIDVEIKCLTNTYLQINNTQNGSSRINIISGIGDITVVYALPDNETWTTAITPLLEDCDNCPATVIELENFANGSQAYDISLVDGFNRPASIGPLTADVCAEVACMTNINEICPDDNQVLDNGTVIACAPAPELFKETCPDVITSADDQGTVATCTDQNVYSIIIG